MDIIVEIVTKLERQGVKFRLDGDRVGFKPASKVPEHIKQKLKEHKKEVIEFLRKRGVKPVNLENILTKDVKELKRWLEGCGGYVLVKSEILNDTIALCLPEYRQQVEGQGLVVYNIDEILHLLVEKPSPKELQLIHGAKVAFPGSRIYRLSTPEKIASRLFNEALKELQKSYQPALVKKATGDLKIRYLQQELDKTWLDLLQGKSSLESFKRALEKWSSGIRQKLEGLQ